MQNVQLFWTSNQKACIVNIVDAAWLVAVAFLSWHHWTAYLLVLAHIDGVLLNKDIHPTVYSILLCMGLISWPLSTAESPYKGHMNWTRAQWKKVTWSVKSCFLLHYLDGLVL